MNHATLFLFATPITRKVLPEMLRKSFIAARRKPTLCLARAQVVGGVSAPRSQQVMSGWLSCRNLTLGLLPRDGEIDVQHPFVAVLDAAAHEMEIPHRLLAADLDGDG